MINYSLDQINSVKANVDSPIFTGKVIIPQGSASNPGLAFTGDISNDTGLFLINDGQLGITCNGIQVATFTPSNIKLIGYGNNTVVIGNGTDNGVDKLQVSGSINTATPNGYITECGGFLPIIGDTNSAYAGSAGNIATITDLNNLTRTGIYNGHDLTNAPEAGWIFVQHKQHSNPSSNAWAQQILTTMGAGNTANRVYIRTKVNSTWSSWHRVIISEDSGNFLINIGLDNGIDKLQVGGSINAVPYKATDITKATYGAINIAEVRLDSGNYFATALRQTTLVSGGYRQYLTIGAYRDGTNSYNGGCFIGLGVNSDNNPTEYYNLGVGGNITHSSGSKFWHNLNDGSGSGLDADLLDGIDSTGFVKKGEFLLGTNAPYITDANVIATTQWNQVSGTWNGSPFSGANGNNQGYLFTQVWTGSNTYRLQTFYNINSDFVSAWRRMDNGVWSNWVFNWTYGTSNGNVLIGTTTDNGVDKLQINGSIKASTITATNRIIAPTGTGSNGGFGFDSDTGMVSSGDGNLKFYTNNVYAGGPITGTNNWDINITGSAIYALNQDTDRDAGTKLPTTSPHSVRYDFVNSGTAGSPGSAYCGVMTYTPYDGKSVGGGGQSYQLSYGSNAQGIGTIPVLQIRNGIDSTWNPWYKIWHSGNVGAGSGLDADLLDGHDSTYFLPAADGYAYRIKSIGTDNTYGNPGVQLQGNGTTNTVKPTLGFHQPNTYAGTLSMDDGNTFAFKKIDGSRANLVLDKLLVGTNTDNGVDKLQIAGSLSAGAITSNSRFTAATSSGAYGGFGFDNDTGMVSNGDGNLKFYTNNVYAGGPITGTNTWDINITGNAGSATSATYALTMPAGTQTTQIATTAFVTTADNNLQAQINGKQNALGFTPVQQGTGVGQSNNTIKLGWSGSRLKATVDSTDLGNILTTANVSLSGTTLYINL